MVILFLLKKVCFVKRLKQLIIHISLCFKTLLEATLVGYLNNQACFVLIAVKMPMPYSHVVMMPSAKYQQMPENNNSKVILQDCQSTLTCKTPHAFRVMLNQLLQTSLKKTICFSLIYRNQLSHLKFKVKIHLTKTIKLNQAWLCNK